MTDAECKQRRVLRAGSERHGFWPHTRKRLVRHFDQLRHIYLVGTGQSVIAAQARTRRRKRISTNSQAGTGARAFRQSSAALFIIFATKAPLIIAAATKAA